MIPTEENIREVAKARIKAIREKARELGDNETPDDELIEFVIHDAVRFAELGNRGPKTAQEAVAWAIVEMHAVEVDQHAGTD